MTSRFVTVLLAVGAIGCSKAEDRRPSPMAQMAAACAHDSELSCPRPIFTVDGNVLRFGGGIRD